MQKTDQLKFFQTRILNILLTKYKAKLTLNRREHHAAPLTKATLPESRAADGDFLPMSAPVEGLVGYSSSSVISLLLKLNYGCQRPVTTF
jgi:hypothetical protein